MKERRVSRKVPKQPRTPPTFFSVKSKFHTFPVRKKKKQPSAKDLQNFLTSVRENYCCIIIARDIQQRFLHTGSRRGSLIFDTHSYSQP